MKPKNLRRLVVVAKMKIQIGTKESHLLERLVVVGATLEMKWLNLNFSKLYEPFYSGHQ